MARSPLNPSYTPPKFPYPLADLETWLPDSAWWDDDYVPTPEEIAERDENITVAYNKALKRRYRERGKARRAGKPLPTWDEPLEPSAMDYPFTSKPQTQEQKTAHLEWQRRNGYRDIWTPEIVKRSQEAAEEQERYVEQFRQQRKVMDDLYKRRKLAREAGLPVPPTPYEIRTAAFFGVESWSRSPRKDPPKPPEESQPHPA